MTTETFSQRLLHWYDQHGRHQLPWKQNTNAYRVWVSEIMLQQTQVTTVIPYFERFMLRFPSLQALAAANQDEVLHLWTGLGYYARGRNLHKAAQQLVQHHGGEFPSVFDAVTALPGIGRSTAGAILAQAMGQRHPILDGNVKRVLCRYHAIEGWPGERSIENRLWTLAEAHTPQQRLADYTQAIMDLGATLCRRSKPLCDDCPMQQDCQARQLQRQSELPSRKPKKDKPVKATRMLILSNADGEILLQQRPPTGLWGGLWTLPQCDDDSAELHDWVAVELGLMIDQVSSWPGIRHSFSHYHLDITPIVASTRPMTERIMEAGATVWYNSQQPDERGLAAPVVKLLQQLQRSKHL
ncbi:MAG: A/G-specific adenine glycosylase [Gammaproteobacteria bacterium]|nr:A/G-specific adenine glycosylase [Gammaproteobacteria bacterium]